MIEFRRATIAAGCVLLVLAGAACSARTPGGGDGSPAAPAEPGPGVTEDTIRLGLSYVYDQEAANEGVGAGGATQIDQERAYDALIADLNARGGINGREVVPVYRRFSAQSSEPVEQQDQQACVKWTQDEPVFAADSGLGSENLLQCLEDAGAVIQGGDAVHLNGQEFFDRFPHYIHAFGIDLNDLSTVYVQALDDLGFFEAGAKVGVLTFDEPDYRGAIDEALVPALQAAGVQPAAVQYVKPPPSGEEINETVAQIQSTVVRFKGNGVTHVLFLDTGGTLMFFFMQTAEEQDYHPRYGVNSTTGNTTLAGLVPPELAAAQFEGAVGIGWEPTLDVSAADQPAWAATETQTRCHDIMSEAGIALDSSNAQGIAESLCNTIWFWEAALTAAGDTLNQQTFLQGLGNVQYEPISGVGLRVGPDDRDGVAQVANLEFVAECTCFRYTSDPYPVP